MPGARNRKRCRRASHLLSAEELLDLTPHGRVPVVLDGVVSPPGEKLGDLGPAVT